VKQVADKLGPIAVLVNTIGWFGTTRFQDETAEYWRKVIAINFEAVLYVTHPVLLGMIERKKGKIVNISSDAGRVGTSGEAVYAGTKAGLIGFSKSLARECARYNVNVNCIAPGPTETPLLKAEIEENPELIQRMTRLIPFRRVGKPEEMAAAISFFCSSDSDYITGQVLSVSGGLTMV
jgi:2-hydroxycyclohexanecarboxyl-CoA dehydrogenase